LTLGTPSKLTFSLGKMMMHVERSTCHFIYKKKGFCGEI
jgi:hypothetical protein